jgi:diadenosine tetraphosphate (Ap4A) HIT family hydrolase
MANYGCGVCGFKLWLPISELRRSVLGLYDDARFPGRCILALTHHEEQLEDLDPETAAAFLEDARDAARAIARATASPRVNYAVLGNTEPHLHWHLIPRFPDREPLPARPPWEHPENASPLGSGAISELTARIAAELAPSQA